MWSRKGRWCSVCVCVCVCVCVWERERERERETSVGGSSQKLCAFLLLRWQITGYCSGCECTNRMFYRCPQHGITHRTCQRMLASCAVQPSYSARRQKKHSIACVPTDIILGRKLGQNKAVRRCRRGWGIYRHGQSENIHWSHLAQKRFYENCNEHSGCIKVRPFGDQLSGHLVSSWVTVWWSAECPFGDQLIGRLVTSWVAV